MKAKTKIPALFAALLSLLATSCDDFLGEKGHGDTRTETRNVKDFHALDISAHARVDLRVDSVYRVEVSCEESIIDYLETVEDNGVLKIHFDRDVYDVDNLRIRVWAPHWDAIETSGDVDLSAPDALSGDEMDLKLSGSGNMEFFNIEYNKLYSRISGDGNVVLNGQGQALDCTISGSGNIEALDFPVQTAKITISGSGNARVDVSEQLDVVISGSGDVEYRGDPQLNSQVSGSGKVKKI